MTACFTPSPNGKASEVSHASSAGDFGRLVQEQRFRELIDVLPAAIYTTDSEGRLTQFNRAAVELSGRVPELGTDQWCISWKIYDRDGVPLPHDRCPMAIALKEGRAIRGEEIIIERPDGSRVWVMPAPTPLFDDTGRVVGGVNMLVDIAERKQADESRARLAAIVDSSNDAIISKTLDGVITSWNRGAETLFGYTTAEAIGRHITLIVPEDRLPEEDGVLARLRHGEKIEHFETIRHTKDGRKLHVSLTVSPVRDACGRIIGASKVARDITEFRLAERRKDEFLATLAHELRNPLAPLRNALSFLRLAGHAGDTAPVHEMMERQVDHLVRLVDDLLEIARISRGVLELRRERVEVAAIVRDAIDTSNPLIQAGRHQLSVSLPEEPVWLAGDPLRLAQVLANILNNAAKYTDPGGKISLEVRRQGATALISVRDDGVGIAPATLARVFEMFSRGDHEGHGRGGLGIGLALARRLAEMHGGRIEARSDGPGQGSEFTVHLPVATGQAPDVHGKSDASPAMSQKRILVVDDDSDSAESLCMLLEALGADVRVAHDGREALEVFRSYDPAVVLLDICLPDMDGYEVARRLRAEFPERPAAIVALTGWGREEDRRRAQEAGFDHHIIKPVDVCALRALLASLEDMGATPHRNR